MLVQFLPGEHGGGGFNFLQLGCPRPEFPSLFPRRHLDCVPPWPDHAFSVHQREEARQCHSSLLTASSLSAYLPSPSTGRGLAGGGGFFVRLGLPCPVPDWPYFLRKQVKNVTVVISAHVIINRLRTWEGIDGSTGRLLTYKLPGNLEALLGSAAETRRGPSGRKQSRPEYDAFPAPTFPAPVQV